MQGAPVKVWGLKCPHCEDHLRSDPNWAAMISQIPETLDEKITREDFDKRGQLDERKLMAMVMAKAYNLDLPGTLSGVVAGELECAEGHPCQAGVKFCPECGSPVRQDASPAIMVLCPAGHENQAESKFCGECGQPVAAVRALPPAESPEPPVTAPAGDLGSLSAGDLRKLAKARGVAATGTKADILGRLTANAA